MSPSMLRSAETASINDRQRATLEPGDLICTGTPHMFAIAANSGAALHLTALGEMRADEINRVLRRVRAHLLKGVSGEDLAETFETPQRIEHRASRLQEAAAMVEAAQP
jgi:hypothetical protein